MASRIMPALNKKVTAMSETQAEPQISGKMFLFEKPELLNKDLHGNIGVGRPEQIYGFCAKVRAVPITLGEVTSVMRDYPIVLMSEENPLPLAVTGIIDDVNLFVDDKGNWEENVYIPGYVRRYPFGVAAETDGDRMAIVIDRAFTGFVDGGEQRLFDGDNVSEFTQQAIDFTKAFEQDRVQTQRAADVLKSYGLVSGQTAQYTPQGSTEQKSFAQYFGIDEQKFNALSDDQFLELRKSNLLPAIYAQLMSQGNWRTLMLRRARRFNLTEANITEARTLS